jgi:mRNA interferase MazF
VRRGDVVLVVLSGDLGKPRPAVVVQADELGEGITVIVCPMSSEVALSKILRPVLEPSAENGLHATSQVMIDKVSTVRRDRVRRVLGQLDADAQRRVNEALLVTLGLAR